MMNDEWASPVSIHRSSFILHHSLCPFVNKRVSVTGHSFVINARMALIINLLVFWHKP